MRGALVGVLSVCLGALGTTAHAYTITNAYTPGCHEQITSAALRTVRTELPTAAPLPLTHDEEALVNDLQFLPDDDMKDLGGATLLLSVRDNDLKGRGSGDLSELAEVHGDPAGQREHCLRSPGQIEPGGSAAAIADCRSFIRIRILEALDGLTADSKPDLGKRTSLSVHLSIRGRVDASLPTYYVRMGQAVHTIEDSFTHTYRTPDGMQITTVVNWLSFVDKTLVESRDGPPHAALLDVCDDPDDLRKKKRELATLAAAEVFRITLDPNKTHDEKMRGVDAALDKYMSYKPGCTSDNQWCQAPETALQDSSGCGCVVGNATTGSTAALCGVGIGIFAFGWRARRRRANAKVVGAALLGAALLVMPGTAGAATEAPKPAAEVEHSPPPPVVTPVVEPGPRDPSKMAFGAYGGLSGSIDKSALAGTIGARFRLNKRWAFGLDAEFNPWIAVNGSHVRSGAFNVYGTAILRFPLAYNDFNLRSALSLGTSYLLSDFYGAPKGSIGLYFGVSPLGLEWKASRLFYLIVNPINIAVPIPQISGVPLLYPQYRFTIGVEFYTG